jgi:phage shock protein E
MNPSESPARGTFALIAGLSLAAAVLPLAFYGLAEIFTPSVTPRQARKLLAEDPERTALVDVRPADEYQEGHIDGAQSWPLESVLAAHGPSDVPAALGGKTLLMLCRAGGNSRWAAWHLRSVGVAPVWNVHGGVEEWIRDQPQAGDRPFERWQPAAGSPGAYDFRPSPLGEQIAAVAAFFFVKPLYTFLSLGLIGLLWKHREPDLAALRWSMIAFFLGENACAANVLLFHEKSYLLEYLHSLGMLLSFATAAYAVLEGIDRRILRVSDPQRACAALGLCGRCIKHDAAVCGLEQTFRFLIPALMIVALMLPTASWQRGSYTTEIFGVCYHYAHLMVFQAFEDWGCAILSIVLLGSAWAILLVHGHRGIGPSKIALAAGLGPLGFGLLRLLLSAAYDQNRVWSLFWEEVTELLFILGAFVVLAIFRRTLLDRPDDLLLQQDCSRVTS